MAIVIIPMQVILLVTISTVSRHVLIAIDDVFWKCKKAISYDLIRKKPTFFQLETAKKLLKNTFSKILFFGKKGVSAKNGALSSQNAFLCGKQL